MAYTKEIVLGSGKLYAVPYVPGTVIGSLADYCEESNRLGLIQGGAEIAYTPTVYEVKDDLNVIYKRFITAEEATLKSGILTWDLDALNNFIGNKTITVNADGNKVMKLGGNGAREMDEYLVVFCHEFRNHDKIYVGMAGTNDAGLTLAFQPDKETVVDAEFRAISNGEDGCILILEEEKATTTLAASPASLTIAAGGNAVATISGNVGRCYVTVPENSGISAYVSANSDSITFTVAPTATAGSYTCVLQDSTQGGPQTFDITVVVS
jgi:hypothetical protein